MSLKATLAEGAEEIILDPTDMKALLQCYMENKGRNKVHKQLQPSTQSGEGWAFKSGPIHITKDNGKADR